FAREQPDIVRRYVRSQVEAVHRIYTDKQTSLQVLRKYFRGNVEPDLLEKTWELLTERAMFPKKQYPTIDGIKFILAPLAEKDARRKVTKHEYFVFLISKKNPNKSDYIDTLNKP